MPTDWVILHGGALGDLVLTMQLALRLPGIEAGGTLHLVSRTDPGDLSACRPRIVRESSDTCGLHWLFADLDSAAPRRLHELVRGAHVLNALTGPNTTVHRRLTSLGPRSLYSFDPRPQSASQRHITEQWITQLECQGLLIPKCVHQRPHQRGIAIPGAWRERGRRLFDPLVDASALQPPHNASAGLPYDAKAGDRLDPVLIHPGSGGRAKCWALRCFIEVARHVTATGQPVAFLVGPAELDNWPPSDLTALEAVAPLIRQPSPDDLVALLSAARAFIGNDAGPTHLAAILGTFTVALFGPTSPAVWRPLGPNVQVLAGNPAVAPDTWGLCPRVVAATVSRGVGSAVQAAENDADR